MKRAFKRNKCERGSKPLVDAAFNAFLATDGNGDANDDVVRDGEEEEEEDDDEDEEEEEEEENEETSSDGSHDSDDDEVGRCKLNSVGPIA
jgi:hypothetical protein